MKYLSVSWFLFSLGVFALCLFVVKNFIAIFCTGAYMVCISNWVTSSVFFDPTIMGDNQRIYGWVVAIFLFVCGIFYNVLERIKDKKIEEYNKECKKNARNKYKDMIRRVTEIEANVLDGKRVLHEISSQLEQSIKQ